MTRRAAIWAVDGLWKGGGGEGVRGGIRVVRRAVIDSRGHGCEINVSVSVRARKVREGRRSG